MEECKELFENKSNLPDTELIDQIKAKLTEKLRRITEVTSEISNEEALKMIGLLEKKVQCFDRCKKLFTQRSLSTNDSIDE
ncbi:hypothetical protein NEPAR06_0894 [Nematocida parisii]|uniref:Uncharacterized protein n=1 Tax=Nematocida parisii (strain ERTm3) TaxID=935791 RepID=I3EDS2_NEMP3|nr:hypothetical protein NEQG_02492 [Nematocida parisii ERTm3]KAI5127543.1 hypothetical protein NEPAR08_0913 [Nematocida parisii]KAI5127818.1 hypothetical protein NEPAR03_1098 [Nematocida parisii]KAI5141612.1 hypothetical protein NEPAR04_1089 [Nematocida parisii]KAI5145607.1 hypothetical protein NEPAR07_1807 [Nematocida parisii]